MADSDDQPPQGDWRPRPDPTALTTEALLREIEHLDRLINQRIGQVETRLDARIDHAVSHLRESMGDQIELRNAIIGASERAIEKASIANEKRFDQEHVAMARLAEQVSQVVPRSEATVAHAGIIGKLEDQILRTAERFQDVNHQLDRITGLQAGAQGRDQKVFGVIGAVAGVLASMVAIAALIAVIVR